MVDWNKEISFRRKPKAKGEPAGPPEQAAPAQPSPAPEAKAEKTSIWKKDIGLGRKSKAKRVKDERKQLRWADQPEPAAGLEGDGFGHIPEDALFGAAPIEASLPVFEPEPEPEVTPEPEPELVLEPAAEVEADPEPLHVLEPDPLFAPVDDEPEPQLPPAAEADLEPVGAALSQPEADELFLPGADDEAAAQYFPPDREVFDLSPVDEQQEHEAPASVLPPADPALGWPGAEAESEPEVEVEVEPDVLVQALSEVVDAVPETVSVPVLEPEAQVADEAVADEPAQAAENTRPPLVKRALDFRRRGAGGSSRGTKLKSLDDEAQKAKKVVGLKIGASQISAARVSNNGHVEVLQLAREPLEQGIVVGGELRDPDALATALRTFFRKNRLPRRNIRLGISNNRIGVRIFEISGIDDPSQLKNAIRFRAQETLPIPLDEAVLDYQIVGEWVNDDGMKTRRVLLVVAYRELVDRYVAACRKAGLRLIGIDLEAFGLLRALAAREDQNDGEERAGLVVVSIGHDRTTLAVSDGRVCEFTRVLDWGGFSISVAIARVLDLTPSEAEPIKTALSLADPSVVPAHLDEEKAAKLHEAVTRQLESFARDLVSSLRFYQNQPGSLGIGEIVLTGGTAALPGLAEELERLIGVSVRIGDPLANVKAGRKVNSKKSKHPLGSVAAAIGLGMEV